MIVTFNKTWEIYTKWFNKIRSVETQGWRLKICQRFSQSLEQFFLTAGQNNFVNKIPFIISLNICLYWTVLRIVTRAKVKNLSRLSQFWFLWRLDNFWGFEYFGIKAWNSIIKKYLLLGGTKNRHPCFKHL